ncbi:MAG: signal recognition particle receptor subunit alpha, partial [Deltaproteobacteria bacterium]|nr:signal recognition particle receptor subunit alpha [Deltaproteobacteria bacterium]
MFAPLTERFTQLFRRLRGHGVITPEHLREAGEALRAALLQADVHHAVVDRFLKAVESAAVGQEVTKGQRPVDHYLRIVHAELARVLGGATPQLALSGKPPIVILCVGLQGSGKTTTVAKLAA